MSSLKSLGSRLHIFMDTARRLLKKKDFAPVLKELLQSFFLIFSRAAI